MSRFSINRRVAAVAVAVSVGTGLGAGAVGLLSVASADAPTTGTPTGATTGAPAPAPGPGPAPAAGPLTADQAAAVATQASPGRVTEVEQDADEPTGLRYDVTVMHDDGTSTEIEVAAADGQILSTELDDDRDGD
jgi:hypothetical protein